MINKDGDVIEEKDKYKEIPQQKRILKSNVKRIN